MVALEQTIAGPIASLMIEKYLRKKITRTDLETRILKTSLKEQYAKLGGMKEANAIETTPKDSISNDNVVNTSAPIDSTNQN
jgi:penicillin-binding protein 2